MNSSLDKRQDEKPIIPFGVTQVKDINERDYKTQMISQMVLNEILQKAQDIKNRNSQLNRFVQSQKLKQSERFTAENSTEILNNFFLKPQQLSPQMANQNYLASPSKSPYSFLNYEDQDLETDRQNLARQTWQQGRNTTKIYNCNKIYILKKKINNKSNIDKNFSIKSIKLNDTLPSAFRRPSQKSQIKRVSINHNNFIHRLSIHARSSANLLGSVTDHGSRNNLLQVSKKFINRSSFHDENIAEKGEQEKDKLIKLQSNKLKESQKYDHKEIQTNEHIAFLRQRKQKLQKIMKVFDIDDQQKKKHKIQRQNLLKQIKPQNLAQTFSKMPAVTTDYEGNAVFYKDPLHKKTQRNLQNHSKKSYIRFPKYEIHEEGALSHTVNFKIKDIDDKTKNFLNHVFSSAFGTPMKSSHKKIAFNMKKTQINTKFNANKKRRTQKNLSSKISVAYENKTQQQFKNQDQERESESLDLKNKNALKNISIHGKGRKSAIKLPLKTQRGDSLNSRRDKNKENLDLDKVLENSKNQSFVLNRYKINLKTEQSSRSNILNKNSLKQLEAINRQAYATHRQRKHPNLSKIKKATISTQQNDYKKIRQTSNQDTERNHTESQHRPLKNFFQGFIQKDTKFYS